MKNWRNVFLIIPAVFISTALLASLLPENKDGAETAWRGEIIRKQQQLRILFIDNEEKTKGSQ